MDKERTGQLITELRKEKGLTQKQLADALNVTDKAVSKWERGLSFPDISMLEPISEVLGISIMEILAGERQDASETISREEAQKIVSASVELSDEEIRHKKERSRLIIIILIVFLLLLISLTLNVVSLLRS
jgi:transcriptional regulator with XRE-family HTH domain